VYKCLYDKGISQQCACELWLFTFVAKIKSIVFLAKKAFFFDKACAGS
jgi:hypothetical protein